MVILPEITETNLQPAVRVHMQIGHFYKAANRSIWCCFQYYDEFYHCIRIPDNVIARFEADGRLQRDDGGAEDTLVERVLYPNLETSVSIVERLNSIIGQLDDVAAIVEGQTAVVNKLTFRLRYLRTVLGKIANGNYTAEKAATSAQDALLWLADKESNPLGDT